MTVVYRGEDFVNYSAALEGFIYILLVQGMELLKCRVEIIRRKGRKKNTVI